MHVRARRARGLKRAASTQAPGTDGRPPVQMRTPARVHAQHYSPTDRWTDLVRGDGRDDLDALGAVLRQAALGGVQRVAHHALVVALELGLLRSAAAQAAQRQASAKPV